MWIITDSSFFGIDSLECLNMYVTKIILGALLVVLKNSEVEFDPEPDFKFCEYWVKYFF